MNLLKAIRYGRRFKKPGGLYIETDSNGAFVTNVPGKGLTHVQFYKTDFEIDTWELEPQKPQLPAEPVATLDRLDMGLNLIRQAFHELAERGKT